MDLDRDMIKRQLLMQNNHVTKRLQYKVLVNTGELLSDIGDKPTMISLASIFRPLRPYTPNVTNLFSIILPNCKRIA